MEENNNENLYKIYSSDMKEKKPSFLKNAIVPFCSSVLGTALVIGVCFGISGIKNTILNTETVTTDTGLTITEGKVNNTVSLPDYSNTSIAVANKVLPSIVGITVEYKVNSMFGGSSISEASRRKKRGGRASK